MKSQQIIVLIVTALLLAGCHSTTVTPQPPAFNSDGSWIRHSISQGPLIYASGSFEWVLIYDYTGQQVGQLGRFEYPSGLCSDAAGDVWVTDGQLGLIYGYPAGASLPDDVIDDRGELASGCAVDPTSGSLAVFNAGNGTNGNVLVFPPGSDTNPAVYTAPNITTYAFGGYDPSGNLYVDGTGLKQSFQLAALDKGSKNFVAVPLSGLNNKNHRAAAVQWDGTYLAVGDALNGVVYRLAISGSSATVAQTVTLRGWHNHFPIEFAIAGKKLLLPHDNKLLFYSYPAGGKFKNGFLAEVGGDITVTGAQK